MELVMPRAKTPKESELHKRGPKILTPLCQMLLPTAPSFMKLSILHYIVTKTTRVKFQPNLNKTLENVSKKNSLCPQVKCCIYTNYCKRTLKLRQNA